MIAWIRVLYVVLLLGLMLPVAALVWSQEDMPLDRPGSAVMPENDSDEGEEVLNSSPVVVQQVPVTDAEIIYQPQASAANRKDAVTGYVWPQEVTNKKGVTVRVLDKITARTALVKLPFHQPQKYGTLELISRRCVQSASDERPEHKALLEVWENEPTSEPERVFWGWMFASSPSLSAMEHPVYDVTVKECY